MDDLDLDLDLDLDNLGLDINTDAGTEKAEEKSDSKSADGDLNLDLDLDLGDDSLFNDTTIAEPKAEEAPVPAVAKTENKEETDSNLDNTYFNDSLFNDSMMPPTPAPARRNNQNLATPHPDLDDSIFAGINLDETTTATNITTATPATTTTTTTDVNTTPDAAATPLDAGDLNIDLGLDLDLDLDGGDGSKAEEKEADSFDIDSIDNDDSYTDFDDTVASIEPIEVQDSFFDQSMMIAEEPAPSSITASPSTSSSATTTDATQEQEKADSIEDELIEEPLIDTEEAADANTDIDIDIDTDVDAGTTDDKGNDTDIDNDNDNDSNDNDDDMYSNDDNSNDTGSKAKGADLGVFLLDMVDAADALGVSNSATTADKENRAKSPSEEKSKFIKHIPRLWRDADESQLTMTQQEIIKYVPTDDIYRVANATLRKVALPDVAPTTGTWRTVELCVKRHVDHKTKDIFFRRTLKAKREARKKKKEETADFYHRRRMVERKGQRNLEREKKKELARERALRAKVLANKKKQETKLKVMRRKHLIKNGEIDRKRFRTAQKNLEKHNNETKLAERTMHQKERRAANKLKVKKVHILNCKIDEKWKQRNQELAEERKEYYDFTKTSFRKLKQEQMKKEKKRLKRRTEL